MCKSQPAITTATIRAHPVRASNRNHAGRALVTVAVAGGAATIIVSRDNGLALGLERVEHLVRRTARIAGMRRSVRRGGARRAALEGARERPRRSVHVDGRTGADPIRG